MVGVARVLGSSNWRVRGLPVVAAGDSERTVKEGGVQGSWGNIGK